MLFRSLKCRIERDKSGLYKKMFPRYNLITSNGGHFLIAANTVTILGSAHYIITMETDDMTKNAPGYLGKLRSNTIRTEYNLFGPGENPSGNFPPDRIRSQFGSILYVKIIYK